jgi:hypothetical protein
MEQRLIPSVSIFNPLSISAGILNGISSLLTLRATYSIAGTYCEPEVHNTTRKNTLQFLAHPATYDRNYVCSMRASGY